MSAYNYPDDYPEEGRVSCSPENAMLIVRAIEEITFLDRMRPIMEGVARELIKAGCRIPPPAPRRLPPFE